jgi:outer membrane lipoprotein-sorting protein
MKNFKTTIIPSAISLFIYAFISSPSFAQTSLGKIEDYLNSFRSLHGDFQQLSPDGSLVSGDFFIDKPGRMRLDYKHPSSQIIFSHDGVLYLYDASTKEVSQTELSQSIADLLLREAVQLESNDVKIKNFEEDDQTVHLTLQKAGGEDLGELTLVFNQKPLKLIQWVIVDPQSQRTEVTVSNLQKNKPISKTTDPQEIIQP